MCKNVRLIILLIFSLVSNYAYAQDCPVSNNRKNASCLKVTYASAGEALLAFSSGEVLTVTMSPGGSADGVYTASQICGTAELVYTKNGSNSCNCNGYNGTTAGTFTFQESGLTCIYNADGSLPVNLVKFIVEQKGDVLYLEWETSDEVNNAGFSLESSKDGRTFQEVKYVKGNGSSTSLTKYKAIVDNPIQGENYFRLKQIDFNGDFQYSDIISILFRTKSEVYFKFDSEVSALEIRSKESISSLVLYDIKGVPVKSWKNIDGVSRVNLHEQSASIYIASCQLKNGEIVNYRFVKF